MSTKMYQVTEDDLAVLESELPRLLDEMYMACNNPITCKRWEAVRDIVMRIRWNYGPPTKCEEIES